MDNRDFEDKHERKVRQINLHQYPLNIHLLCHPDFVNCKRKGQKEHK